MKEQEYLDVPVAEIAVGDEVKVDGIGYTRIESAGREAYASEFNPLLSFYGTNLVLIKRSDGEIYFRRSSITQARRQVEPKVEEKPKPNHNHAWIGNVSVSGFRCGLCGVEVATIDGVIARGVGTCNAKPIEPPKQEPKLRAGEWRRKHYVTGVWIYDELAWMSSTGEVYRASTSSWSADTRKGQRRQGGKWELKAGAKVKAFGWGCSLRIHDECTHFDGDELIVTSLRGSNPTDVSVNGLRGEHDIHARNLDLIDRREQQGDRRKS